MADEHTWELRIRLAGNGSADDLAKAVAAARVGILDHYGAAPPPAPTVASNGCDDEGCKYLDTVVIDGKKYRVYQCGDVVAMYPE